MKLCEVRAVLTHATLITPLKVRGRVTCTYYEAQTWSTPDKYAVIAVISLPHESIFAHKKCQGKKSLSSYALKRRLKAPINVNLVVYQL